MRYVTAIVFFLIAGLPYAGILWQSTKTAPEDTSPDPREILQVMSPHRREVRLEYSRGFREWMRREHRRDVAIQWLDAGGTSKMLKDLESRYTQSPDRPGVDVLFGGGVTPYYTALDKGWLTPVSLPEPLLRDIPRLCAGAPVYDSEQRWFGVALSGFGILYNRPVIQRLHLPVPESWEDLGRPEYESWIASGDPRSSGTVRMCYDIILQAHGFEKGWALITRICANVRSFGEGGGVAPREVASGDAAAGMVIDQYAQTVIRALGRDELVFILPRGLTMVGPDAIAVLKGSASPDLSVRFLEYVLSEEGQRLLYQPAGTNGQRHSLYRLPVRKPMYDQPGAPETRPYEFVSAFQYDERKGNRRATVVNDLIGTWMIDAHPDLVTAWKAVIKTGFNETQVARLCQAPVSESDLNRLASVWHDQKQRRETITQWENSARARYRGIASGKE